MTNRTFDYITYEVDKGRARITLNRPEKRNALSIELVEELRSRARDVLLTQAIEICLGK